MFVGILKTLKPIRGLSAGARYALTTLIVLACLAGRLMLDAGTVDFAAPFILFLPGIVLASVAFDRGAGFYATVLSGALALYFFVEPRNSFEVLHLGQAITLAALLAVGFLIAGLLEAVRNTADQLARTNADLLTENRQLAEAIEESRRAETVLHGGEKLAQAEEALRASEARNRLIVESARDYAILTTDPDGRITAWPPGAQSVFGYAPDEIIGQDVALLFTPEDRAAGAPECEREEARRNGHARDQRWHVRKDGERFWIDGSAWPLRDYAGREHGFLKVGRDDTLRRRADLLMKEAIERQAMVTREVGHRIKNNLAIVTSLLTLQARDAASDETRDALVAARARIEAIAQVHDQLWRQDQADTIDLGAFLRDLCSKVQDAVPHHRILYEGEPMAVGIDRAVPISLLVNELITNAVKYAYAGQEGGPIAVTLRRLDGSRFQLEVRDQGVGMPAELTATSKPDSFGGKLIRTFTRQIGATVEFDLQPPGTRIVLTIPIEKDATRP